MIEYRMGSRDGFQRWLRVSGQRRHISDGSTRLIGTVLDVTREKEFETVLRESEEHFRLLAEANPQIVWTADAGGTINYFNGRWAEFTGMELHASCDGQWVSLVHPEDRKALESAWKKALSSNAAFEAEHRLRSRSGEFRWFLCRALPVRQSCGNAGWIGTSTDIDESRRLQTELSQAKDEADAANEAKSVFLANMSHEIRNPLGAIIGFVEILEDEGLPRKEQREYIEAIRRNGEELAKLIDDILDLSKVEAARFQIEKLPISLPWLLDDVMTVLTPKARAKGLKLLIKAGRDVPETILSDPTRLRQILINIAGNAVKFTPEGGRVIVTTALARNSETGKKELAFCVEDTGIGLSPEAAARLFSPFSQADASTTRRFGGTGLGLVLSKKLAQALGGDVRLLSSESGRGSSFEVTIDPDTLSGTHASLNENAAGRPDILEKSTALKGIRVLVADDSPDNQTLCRQILLGFGAEVDLAANGAEAIEMAKSSDYNLILMDIQMPVLDGHDAARELRRGGYKKPIIALTAHAMSGELEKCLASGCDDHLTKPLDWKGLVQKISVLTGTGNFTEKE